MRRRGRGREGEEGEEEREGRGRAGGRDANIAWKVVRTCQLVMSPSLLQSHKPVQQFSLQILDYLLAFFSTGPAYSLREWSLPRC